MNAQTRNPIVTTPQPVTCPDTMCSGKTDGNYAYDYNGNYDAHYFVQCTDGLANCQACWPMSLVYSQECNQCLYNAGDECITTKAWTPVATYLCPDMCPSNGHDFSGNMYDPYNSHQYIACWKGVTVGCVRCPGDLLFNYEKNACLYKGFYFTKPLGHDDDDDYV